MNAFEFFALLLLAGGLTLFGMVGFGALQLAQRWMTLLEKAAERPKPRDLDPIPADLVAFANREESPWAREDMRKHLYEMYAESNDWNKVRNTVLLVAEGS